MREHGDFFCILLCQQDCLPRHPNSMLSTIVMLCRLARTNYHSSSSPLSTVSICTFKPELDDGKPKQNSVHSVANLRKTHALRPRPGNQQVLDVGGAELCRTHFTLKRRMTLPTLSTRINACKRSLESCFFQSFHSHNGSDLCDHVRATNLKNAKTHPTPQDRG
jgi:hypothetical protein